jgi:glyoxylate reductase
VVVARGLPAAGLDLLAERFEVDAGELTLDRDELLRRVPGAAAIIADPTVPVDVELLDAAGPSLRVVANFAVGYDNVDLDECRDRGVVVTNTPDVLTNATAELALALMLAAARRLGEAERLLRRGGWTGWEPEQLLGRELSGATVGIVGLGRIGTRVAELLQGFESELLYTARSAGAHSIWAEARLGLERVELDELVARADFVTLHVPLTPVTRHLVDAALLERFKPGAVLVNTARGGLVEARALASALRRTRRVRARARGGAGAARAGERRAAAARGLGDRLDQGRDGPARRRERDRGACGEAAPGAGFPLAARIPRASARRPDRVETNLLAIWEKRPLAGLDIRAPMSHDARRGWTLSSTRTSQASPPEAAGPHASRAARTASSTSRCSAPSRRRSRARPTGRRTRTASGRLSSSRSCSARSAGRSPSRSSPLTPERGRPDRPFLRAGARSSARRPCR